MGPLGYGHVALPLHPVASTIQLIGPPILPLLHPPIPSPAPPPQEQYIFIHDAILEYIFPGTRLMTPDELTAALKAAKPKDKNSKLTGFEEEFSVSRFLPHFVKL